MWLELLYGRIVAAALGTLLGVCTLLVGTKFIRNRVKPLSPLVRAHGALFAVMMGAVAVTAIIASVKDPPANQMQQVVSPRMAPLRMGTSSHITDENIADGYRVAEMREGCEIVGRDAFDAPQMHMPWLLRGGFMDATRIAPSGWSFPWCDGMLHGITVLSRGEIRPDVRTLYFPRPFDAPLAMVPSFNWRLLPGGVSNVFWHAVSPSNSLVVTWENSPVNRDVNSLTNFQAELFADGSFVYRYDDRTVAYSRVHPLDLDFDGLPNAMDPAPETPLGASAWNQSDAWAAAAFPSNAAEIASAGGYAAWAARRASDPNRRLVGLGVASPGGRWPICVEVGGVPVMADGSSDLLYALDCGAQVPFSLSDGGLGAVTVSCVSPDFQTFTLSNFQTFSFPYECMIGDVTLHLDTPRTGWLRRIVEVSVETSNLTHLHPGDTAQLAAVVTNCHADAYLGCTWHGGAGISFSNAHSLTTTVSYASSSLVQWATNNAFLVTSYMGGYCVTNANWFTVGVNLEPTPTFTIDCQDVFFLNDADVLDGGATNRPERIRPVTLNLLGPYGTSGTVKLSSQGAASPVMFYIDNGVTNLITETTEIPLEVTDSFTRTGTNTFYVSCPRKGTGTISATLTLDGGETLAATSSFKCIESLRKLVTTKKIDGRFINPSRLVMGTNAVLQVGVNGDFDATNVHWRIVSGAASLSPASGFTTIVTPTGTNEDVVVEARFNDDEIQPRFVLPVVMPRMINLRAFVAVNHEGEPAITKKKLNEMIEAANIIFSQVGLSFQLQCDPVTCGEPDDWNLTMYKIVELHIGDDDLSYEEYTPQFMRLVKPNLPCDGDGIDMFFVGTLKFAAEKGAELFALCLSGKVVIPRGFGNQTLAHELGHALGLKDIYLDTRYRIEGESANWKTLSKASVSVTGDCFGSHPRDWVAENGRGFYNKSDTLGVVIRKLLMYGMSEFGETSEDMPDDTVFGIVSYGAEELVKVGADKIDKVKGIGNEQP